jgi:hypothetical protein
MSLSCSAQKIGNWEVALGRGGWPGGGMKQLSASGYQVTITATELALVRSALREAERFSRFGIEVLGDVDNPRDGEPLGNDRLRHELEALAAREASLRSLQKTMTEVDGGRVGAHAGR